MFSLDQLLERAVDHANSVLVGKKDAELLPTWLIQYKNQPTTLVATPWSGETEKAIMVKAMRIWMLTHRTVNYSFLSEAWMATEDAKHPTGLMPSQREDKKEVVIVSACDPKDTRMVMLDVLRNSDGVVSALPPQEDKDYTGFEGRLVNLLRS